MAATALKNPIWVAGTMSGTSLDGVDVAMVLTDGVRVHELGPTFFRPYTKAEQKLLRAQLGTWQADEAACELIETAHAEALSKLQGFELIGFHGVTFNHAPHEGRTYQAGNGAVLAHVFGVPVIWDFRSNDVQMGGQGAPLAPFFHHALAREARLERPVCFLNLGGVGNVTWVDPTQAVPEDPNALLAFDTGPCNAPINDAVQSRFGLGFDKDGEIAAKGVVNEDLVDELMIHPYFAKLPPKSLDRNTFEGVTDQVAGLSDKDAISTLTAMAAAGVDRAMAQIPAEPAVIYTCGGGRHNKTLITRLRDTVDAQIVPIERLEFAGQKLNGDFIEAQAFAYLAARVFAGLPTSAPTTTGVAAAVGGGKIARP